MIRERNAVRSRRSQAITLGASLLATLLLLEAGLRAFGYVPYYLDRNAFKPSRNAALLYELRPGFQGLYAAVPIRINSKGLRGEELPNGISTPVIIVGDSVAFGQGVNEGETLSEQLTKLLRPKLGPAQVANLGVPGYESCQELESVREKGFRLNPRVLVLLYYENDTDDQLFRVVGDTVISPDTRTGAFADFMAAARKTSYLYNLLWTRWNVLKAGRHSDERYSIVLAHKFNEQNPGWLKSRSCMAELIATARSRGIRNIVIPFPVLSGLDKDPYPFQVYISTVCSAAQSAGAECFDTVPELRQLNSRPTVSRIDPHPSAAVLAKIAVRLAEMIR